MNNGLYLLNIAKYIKTYEHKLCAFDSRLHANLPVLAESIFVSLIFFYFTHIPTHSHLHLAIYIFFCANFSVQIFRFAKIKTTQQTKICTFQSFCSFKTAKICGAKQTGFISGFSPNINYTIFFNMAMWYALFIRVVTILTKYNFINLRVK